MNSSCAASDEDLSEPLAISAACFAAMGLLCCIQMFFMIGLTFQRRSGLYFWSLVGAAFSQALVCFSILVKNWILKDRLTGIPIAMSTLGYLFYSPCEYLVLYSRLHLLQASNRALKTALILTILEFVLAELPMALVGVLFVIYPDSSAITLANNITWEFEEAVYPTVDFILCSLYFLQVKRMWGNSEERMKWVLRHVVIMTGLLMLIDVSFLILTNTMNWDWADAIESFLFAFKLHIEIYTLNMLTSISNKKRSQAHANFALDTTETTFGQSTSSRTASDPEEAKSAHIHSQVLDSPKKSGERKRRSLAGSINCSYP